MTTFSNASTSIHAMSCHLDTFNHTFILTLRPLNSPTPFREMVYEDDAADTSATTMTMTRTFLWA